MTAMGRPGLTRRTALTIAALGAGATPAAAIGGVFQESGLGGVSAWATAGDKQRIRYETFGGGKTAVVLIHGWTCDRSYWNAQVLALATDFVVVAMDLVGHGDSDKTRVEWSMEQLGDDVARVVTAAGAEQAILVGHSMGGPVAIEAARRLPRVARGVVTIDILTALEPPKAPKSPPMTAADYRAEAPTAIRGGMFVPNSDAGLADKITKGMTSGSPAIALALSDALGAYDSRAGLEAIRPLPLTMIDAGNRTVDAAGLRRAHPGARLFLIEGVGHFVMIEDPATFNALLRNEIGMMTGRVIAL
jgi:pimeloyl-ACP methyl ester carboxylesterase